LRAQLEMQNQPPKVVQVVHLDPEELERCEAQ